MFFENIFIETLNKKTLTILVRASGITIYKSESKAFVLSIILKFKAQSIRNFVFLKQLFIFQIKGDLE
jgi:hypothetical protein